jgi:hypothetical protein
MTKQGVTPTCAVDIKKFYKEFIMTTKNLFFGTLIIVLMFELVLAGCTGQTKPGLYDGKSFKGEKDINEALNWISQNIQSGRNYTIVIGGNQKLSPVTLEYGGRQATITLKASEGGGIRKITGGVFTIAEGVTLVMEAGVVLSGPLNDPLVCIEGGNLVMNGGEISGNDRFATSGVEVKGGTFTMNGGTISKNFWGVFVYADGDYGESYGGGTFTMKGGNIAGNSDSGVLVNTGGVFSKTGGVIYGVDAPEESKQRHAVNFCDSGGRPIKSRNTTADETIAMTITKDDPGDGWE